MTEARRREIQLTERRAFKFRGIELGNSSLAIVAENQRALAVSLSAQRVHQFLITGENRNRSLKKITPDPLDLQLQNLALAVGQSLEGEDIPADMRIKIVVNMAAHINLALPRQCGSTAIGTTVNSSRIFRKKGGGSRIG